MAPVKRILLYTDFSEASEEAMRYAQAVTEAFDASLVILHVAGEPFSAGWTSEVDPAGLPRLHEAMEAEAREQLAHVFGDLEALGSRIKLALETGSAHEAVAQYVKEERIDLVILTASGAESSELEDLVEELASDGRCSALIVRRAPADQGENSDTTHE